MSNRENELVIPTLKDQLKATMRKKKIICNACRKVLVLKLIEVKDLTFCSNKCFGEYIDKMGQENFQRQYGNIFMLDKMKDGNTNKNQYSTYSSNNKRK